MKKLYLAYLWADSADRLIEDHDVMFVVAEDAFEAKAKAKAKTILKSGVHLDVMIEIKNVDGFDIELIESWNQESITKVMDYYTVVPE